ncbi:helix-turn-helix domain-containing protein [Roseovarius mucosus]|uniref:helix-turn-helix domain-containing protein n=2 Tax=Roseovarius mucosus TaxID=215743 RepID=UPI003F71AC6D
MGFMTVDVPNFVSDRPILRQDRLSSLMSALRPVATPCAADDPRAALVLTPTLLVLFTRPPNTPEPDALVATRLECALPLAQALHGSPARLAVARENCPGLAALADVLVAEAQSGRCGSQLAMARLFEAMLVLVLRRAIDAGPPDPGLLAGLSHPRLHRALIAIHAAPARPWTVEMLSAEAGMSRSRFMADFSDCLGTSPLAYVTRWRLGLAHIALIQGASIPVAARSVGYGTTAGFRRAWLRHFGDIPLAAVGSGPAEHPIL